MQYQESVLATIGNTPLIKLSRIGKPISATVFGKVECYNPGQSAKDRIALHMVEQAEKRGELKPGATIVEATSGNTGYSLAMIASLKGYGCVLTVTSKASQEKLALLRSMGAEVVVCPADAEPDDPRSYYQKALQLSKEIPNSFCDPIRSLATLGLMSSCPIWTPSTSYRAAKSTRSLTINSVSPPFEGSSTA